MADIEEPQFNTLAERIAALNKQKNFSTSDTPEPIRKRRPPPRPSVRPAVESRTQSLPAVPAPAPELPARSSPAIPPRPKRNNAPPAIQQDTAVSQDNSRGAAPPLPSRTSSNQCVPNLPPRRSVTQPSSLTARRNSGSSELSQYFTLSSPSVGHTAASSVTSQGSEGSIYKLAPAFDPASLPPLPPTKREREAKQAEEAAQKTEAAKKVTLPKLHVAAARPIPAARQIESAPAPKPGLPPRLPIREEKAQGNVTTTPAEPKLPPRKLPPAPATYVKASLTNGASKQHQQQPQVSTQPPPIPGSRPSESRPSLPSRPQSNNGPPPVPVASRPTFAQIEPISARPAAPSPSVIECWVCHDWSGPDTVAAQFPRQSLPRNDPVGYLAHGLCDPFPSYTYKARAIFTWFHHNVSYDCAVFFGNNVKYQSAEDTIFSGKAVCAGYAETYKAIANRAGLECILVDGHGKGIGHTPLKKGERPSAKMETNHAWNAVRIDGGEWRLLDACWGAGNVDGNTQQFTPEFKPDQFTRPNEKFGWSHFPSKSKNQFRSDGRTLGWEEYCYGEFLGERPTCYSDMYAEGIAPDSVEPRDKEISVYSSEVVRFQFSKVCEHWKSESHGRGKPPLLLLSIHGADGRKDDMVPIETNGYWHWVDVNARDLGAPGQAVQVALLTSIDGKDGRGVSPREFLDKKGKVGMSWSYVARWELM